MVEMGSGWFGVLDWDLLMFFRISKDLLVTGSITMLFLAMLENETPLVPFLSSVSRSNPKNPFKHARRLQKQRICRSGLKLSGLKHFSFLLWSEELTDLVLLSSSEFAGRS